MQNCSTELSAKSGIIILGLENSLMLIMGASGGSNSNENCFVVGKTGGG